jgi:hypothetical protein
VIGGFLSQASNQPGGQMPGQQYQQNPDPSRGGMPSAPGMGQNPPNIDPSNADPQTMDIGALNRMAEYYATNSDYPKVSSRRIIRIGY